MAKKIDLNAHRNKGNQELPFSFEDVLATLPDEQRQEVEKLGINSYEALMALMIKHGLDPKKMLDAAEKELTLGKDFGIEDVMLDDEDYVDDDDEYIDDDDDDDFYDDDDDDDEDDDSYSGDLSDYDSYLSGFDLPKQKFIGKAKREFHIRIKLNNAPVNIWRELVVPSNITLEMLAYVLIDAMGWQHEHLYQYIGKNNVYYLSTLLLKQNENSFMGFFSRSEFRNSDKTSLEMVLQPKGQRLKFEYDYGDSWYHDLWVKGARDYAPDEEPVIKLLKAQGACPPEDCGGVWGYAELLEINQKKRKSDEGRQRLEWYGISNHFNPEDCDLESLQDKVDSLWHEIKDDI